MHHDAVCYLLAVNRRQAESNIKLACILPRREGGRQSQPMEQRGPSSLLEWPSRDRGRRSQCRDLPALWF